MHQWMSETEKMQASTGGIMMVVSRMFKDWLRVDELP
jgi:hypothetical protein